MSAPIEFLPETLDKEKGDIDKEKCDICWGSMHERKSITSDKRRNRVEKYVSAFVVACSKKNKCHC